MGFAQRRSRVHLQGFQRERHLFAGIGQLAVLGLAALFQPLAEGVIALRAENAPQYGSALVGARSKQLPKFALGDHHDLAELILRDAEDVLLDEALDFPLPVYPFAVRKRQHLAGRLIPFAIPALSRHPLQRLADNGILLTAA